MFSKLYLSDVCDALPRLLRSNQSYSDLFLGFLVVYLGFIDCEYSGVFIVSGIQRSRSPVGECNFYNDKGQTGFASIIFSSYRGK